MISPGSFRGGFWSGVSGRFHMSLLALARVLRSLWVWLKVKLRGRCERLPS